MDKQAAGQLADVHLDEWRRNATYADLAYADDNQSSTKQEISAGGVTYTVESTVWREQGEQVYTMAVRVSEAGKRSFFGKSVSRYGRMHPDGRFVLGL
ncbi:hypothetical protein [Antrihabitans sp. YC2-6]|uniref:hypothetical protein n=1 Tax=Antrihabitans sp. YC2-6 TaxID=2799498 RepID=UPI0018F34A58|nr:hypothetical protein [Antrihabitans sp. YC2-6]MBJ8345226.1 hypothetical protein [Antrihabitans sp. YC2-6]